MGEWEALRGILMVRRGMMQAKVDSDENLTVHKCAVATFDYVLAEMDRIEGERLMRTGEPSEAGTSDEGATE